MSATVVNRGSNHSISFFLGSLARNGAKPEFATISSRTVIPDQNELDQVDEEALRRENKEITVDKDNETLTEIVDGKCGLSI